MELSKRLQAVADLVTEGASVADIGTDHGYIPKMCIRDRTRAKRKLVISYVKEKNGKDLLPSRFVSELLLNV